MITSDDVAKVMGWSPRRARRRLLAAGALEKSGRRLVTTFPRLVDRFPEAAHAFGPSRLPAGAQALLETRDVARMLGWTTRRARRWMKREGVGEKRGGRVVTTPHKLRELAWARGGDDPCE